MCDHCTHDNMSSYNYRTPKSYNTRQPDDRSGAVGSSNPRGSTHNDSQQTFFQKMVDYLMKDSNEFKYETSHPIKFKDRCYDTTEKKRCHHEHEHDEWLEADYHHIIYIDTDKKIERHRQNIKEEKERRRAIRRARRDLPT
eukprot:Blabericola_migrator_1__9161@NODE_48_length_16467_cov_53_390427_g44_i0_p13_GENE_NODE_48_length_16467_cov_53_390427_g44_i0NODE_48_length_16467_cov_53_390427_g44_i0_p13_ORF_typecomplete_len141_score23_57RRXRR/PF14239_6/1_1_NODE_48_length_16467_cov_53_390427_g44_i0288710